MRLTVCLEGNTEGRVLASVDMEELVKMTITDDVEKSNFNPQMLKACTDTSYECGYQQGREDAEEEVENRYNRVLDDEKRISYEQGRADAIEECINTLKDFCGGLPNNNLINALEQLKDSNDTKTPCCNCKVDTASCCGCPEYFEWKKQNS